MMYGKKASKDKNKKPMGKKPLKMKNGGTVTVVKGQGSGAGRPKSTSCS